jgi:hypothetical protein
MASIYPPPAENQAEKVPDPFYLPFYLQAKAAEKRAESVLSRSNIIGPNAPGL